MKRTGCLLLLAALLALWELHSVTGDTPVVEPDERPGVCPPERYVDPNVTKRNLFYCDTDANCTAGKKCCVDNKSRMCKPPAEERAGECPPCGNENTKRREDFCTADSECAANLKCCFSDGRFTCLPKILNKPGTCKHDPIHCFIPVRPACDDDSGCSEEEKCCSSGCGMQCMPPLTGFCPPDNVPPGMSTICLENCANCSKTQKCCSHGCGSICKEMSKERLGFCPLNLNKCLPQPPHQCNGDISCADGQKCCKVGCEIKCVPALAARPGCCPVSDNTDCDKPAKPPTPECATDYHCQSPMKCCKVGGTEKCMGPKF